MNSDEDEVVLLLYKASGGLLSWPVALTALGTAMDALICQYLTIEMATGRLAVCEQPSDVVPDAALDYIREYHRCDPHSQHIATMEVGALLNTEVAFPRRSMQNHRFYREFWQPYAVRGLLAAKVDETDGRITIVSIVRSLDQPAFTRDEEAKAARLFGHLVNAAAISRHNARLRVAGLVGQSLMQASTRPMFLLGPGMRLLSQNDAAATYLDAGVSLRMKDGALSACVPAGLRILTKDFERVWTSPDKTVRTALRLPTTNGAAALCLLWNLSPDATMGAFGDERTILLTVADSKASGPIDPVFLAAMLDLSPAEARVAALLAHGAAVPDIAETLHVSLHTVRTQIKSIFGKTGCRRQVELANRVNDLRL